MWLSCTWAGTWWLGRQVGRVSCGPGECGRKEGDGEAERRVWRVRENIFIYITVHYEYDFRLSSFIFQRTQYSR